MRPHPRIRKTIKWGGPFVALWCAVNAWTFFTEDQMWDVVSWSAVPTTTADRMIWPLLTLGAIAATITAWHLDLLARRRARLNLCPTCHYDRTGLAPGAACPECGGAAPKVV